MATITFANGTKVNFDGDPTPEDVEHVASELGISKATPTEKPSLGKEIARTLLNVPAKIGSTLLQAGTSGAALLGSKDANIAAQKIEKEGVDYPLIGKVKPIQSLKESFATGAEAASFAAPTTRAIPVASAIMRGKKLAPIVDLAKTGGTSGALYGAGSEGQNKESGAMDIAKSTLRDAAIGAGSGALLGGFPAIPQLLRKTAKSISARSKDSANIAGEILQGGDEGAKLGKRILPTFNIEGVKTYKDLAGRIGGEIKKDLATVDAQFDKIVDRTKLKDLVRKVTVGEGKTEISRNVNHVDDALGQLKDYFTKTNNTKKRLEVQALLNKARKDGLLPKEINQIAKMHGDELNAFNANGELASGLSKQAAENTRKGLKETARSFVKTGIPETFDKRVSDLIRLKDITDDMVEKVEKLKHRVQQRSVGAKLGRAAVQTLDLFTGGFLRGAVGAAFPSNVGLKTLNSLDLEARLVKNLEVLRYLENAPDGVLETMLRNLTGKPVPASKILFPDQLK